MLARVLIMNVSTTLAHRLWAIVGFSVETQHDIFDRCLIRFSFSLSMDISVVQEEFDELRHVPREKHFDSKNQIGSNPKFKEFNRYRDIIPYDKTRVELNHCDYVNASWVGPGRTYIATQGLYMGGRFLAIF